MDGSSSLTFVAGGVSGALSKTVTAPLARVTILLQIRGGDHQRLKNTPLSPVGILQKVVSDEGMLALWRGNAVSIAQKSLSSGLNFLFFDYGRRICLKPFWESANEPGFKVNFISGVVSGGITSTGLYPLDLARTLRASQRTAIPPGYIEMMKDIWHDGGFSTKNGLYKGVFASIPCHTLNIGLSFAIYYTLKNHDSFKWSGQFGDLASSVFIGGTTGLCASCLTHPMDLIRRRQQVDASGSIRSLAVDIWKKEKLRGFYRGLVPELTKTIPAVTINFIVYDYITACS